MAVQSLLAILLAYLLGSFPSANIASRIVKGQDIRHIGGGNMGTLNTLRQVGFLPGLLVFMADVLKGTLAVLVAWWLGTNEFVVFIAGLAAVVGHNWPVFLGFKGGKGGATGYGIFLGLAPLAASVTFGVMLMIMLLTSNARLSLSGGFLVQPFLIWAFGGSLGLIIYSVAIPLLLGIRMLIADHGKLADLSIRRNLIIDHDYTWWQSRRNKTPRSDKK